MLGTTKQLWRFHFFKATASNYSCFNATAINYFDEELSNKLFMFENLTLLMAENTTPEYVSHIRNDNWTSCVRSRMGEKKLSNSLKLSLEKFYVVQSGKISH